MRLEEIDTHDAAGQRAKALKANAKAAKEKARQLTAQAEASAARLQVQSARQKLVDLQSSVAESGSKPSS